MGILADGLEEPHPLVAGYTCSKCGAKGVKLWRDYNILLDHQELTCYACTPGKDDPDDIRGPGVHTSIGWKVAAIPTPGNTSFWGYTSAPEEGVAWWKALPLEMPKGT